MPRGLHPPPIQRNSETNFHFGRQQIVTKLARLQHTDARTSEFVLLLELVGEVVEFVQFICLGPPLLQQPLLLTCSTVSH